MNNCEFFMFIISVWGGEWCWDHLPRVPTP